MEEIEKENVMEKGGTGRKVLLAIIGVLVVVLIVLGYLIYSKGPSSKNVYLRTIDEFSNSVSKAIDKTDLNKLQELNYNLSFNLNSTNSEYKEIAKIINNIKLNASLEEDYKNKKANVNLDVLYNNSSMIDGNIYINGKDLYAELPSLYSKLIKVPTDETINLDELWNAYNKDNYKTILNELTKIVKNNLKEEYFTSSDEKITVLGKEANTSKQVLTLTGENMYDLENNIINDILNNDKLLKALSDTSNIEVNDLKEELNRTKSELTKEDSKLVVELYLNKSNQKLEYAVMNTDSEKLELSKTSDDTFNILVNSEKIGSIAFLKNGIDLIIDYENTNINLKLSEESLNITAKTEEANISIKLNGNEQKGKTVVNVNIPSEKIDLTINVDYEIKSIKSVKAKDYSNYVELDKMTEDDYNGIMTKLYENESLVTLIQDISNITDGLLTSQVYY